MTEDASTSRDSADGEVVVDLEIYNEEDNDYGMSLGFKSLGRASQVSALITDEAGKLAHDLGEFRFADKADGLNAARELIHSGAGKVMEHSSALAAH